MPYSVCVCVVVHRLQPYTNVNTYIMRYRLLPDLVEYYLPSFRAVIESQSSSSVMCSYNDINGVPSCGNSFLLNQMLREEWGFDGFVISDCGALTNFNFEAYKISRLGNDTARHVASVINSGCDIGCGGLLNDNITYALQERTVNTTTLDQALVRVYRKMIELGQWDGEAKSDAEFSQFGAQSVDTPEHRQLALEAAQQATVLLQNNKATATGTPLLPLRKGTKVAIIGPHARSARRLLSIYVGAGNTVVENQTMERGIERAAGLHGVTVVGTNVGCANNTGGSAAGHPWMDRNAWACTNTSYFEAAATLAKEADIVLMFMGLSPGVNGTDGDSGESEGLDRPNDLSLPGNQSDLVRVVAAANPNVVLTIVHGGASISLEEEKVLCPAIVDAHYPGEMGGDAIASILFGDVSPSGRLTTTM